MAKFSVIIPTYNRLSLLREAVDSVFAQQFTDYDLIVVDDGSSDGTREWLASLGDRVRVFTQPNEGPGRARNLGARQANGEFLAFLDSDDLWFPWTLQTYARCIHENPGCNWLAGRPTYFDCKGKLPQSEGPLKYQLCECLFAAMPGEEVWVPTPAVAFRRDLFTELGGFSDLLIGEDMDLWLRAGCLPGFVRIVEPSVCAERRHPSRITHELRPTLSGINHILEKELSGRYPGGKRFKLVRTARISRATRSISVRCLDGPWIQQGWKLYRKTVRMNLRLGRWRYLTGFPVRACYRAMLKLVPKRSPTANTAP